MLSELFKPEVYHWQSSIKYTGIGQSDLDIYYTYDIHTTENWKCRTEMYPFPYSTSEDSAGGGRLQAHGSKATLMEGFTSVYL